MDNFHNFIGNILKEYDDIYIRLFVQTVEGEVRKLFKTLPANSIDS